jgi:predicted alpha/beta-fold hydrolase
MLKKNKFVNSPEAEQSKTMRDYDDQYTCKILGLKDHTEYYPMCSIYDEVPKFKAPTLIIGAEDDPFIKVSFLPIKEVQSSEKAVLVTYPEGAHVGFCTGMNGHKSIVDTIVPQWFEVIMDRIEQTR